ncbi:hypothetical protein [Streptomyces sp.]|uniref:hypothetical protein n=1 Tax=Streptomyces sp. TaxID=1931 RepID=UPI002811C0BA|nr:hypothetical protein [Streptomyces sp.]
MTAPENHGPVVHDGAVVPLTATGPDPLPRRLRREEPVARVRLPYGEGHAWLVTRYEDVRQITAAPRTSRALTAGRPLPSSTPLTPSPRPAASAVPTRPTAPGCAT